MSTNIYAVNVYMVSSETTFKEFYIGIHRLVGASK